jgi:Iap family predicted aminopeptidase
MSRSLRRATGVLVLALCVLGMMALPSSATAGQTYDQAVDQLIESGYAEKLESDLAAFGTNWLGNRDAGTAADDAAARYIAREMRRIGLTNVRLEPVPVDEWTIKYAYVSAGGRDIYCSAFSGVRSTPFGGLDGEIVYVHGGTALDYAAAGDVTGKIVLVDFQSSLYFCDLLAKEATLRGAKAMILTSDPVNENMYAIGGNAFGSSPALCDRTDVPWVFMPRDDSQWLKAQLKSGPVDGNLRLLATYRSAAKGGTGYNVLGELPGRVDNGQLAVHMSHHDAHFYGALDNASAVVGNLVMAKAMKMSGYRPQRSIVFFSTTGEEYGRANAYYAWLIGSWYSITHQHTRWPGRVTGILNQEMPGCRGGYVTLNSNPELMPWLGKVLSENPELVGGSEPARNEPLAQAWNDQWPFTAAGIPSVTLWAWSDWFHDYIYHTNYDNESLMDWGFFAQNMKLQYRIMQGFCDGLLPYDLSARADHLAATTTGDALKAAGANVSVVDDYIAALDAFKSASEAYDARRADTPAAKVSAANQALLRIEKRINKAFTCLHPFDLTVYPHQNALADVQGLNAAIAALDQPTPDPTTAMYALWGVDLLWYGMSFGQQTFIENCMHHDPAYKYVFWGAQGKLLPPLDELWEAADAVQTGGPYGDAIADMTAARNARLTALDSRLGGMTDVLDQVTPMIEALP